MLSLSFTQRESRSLCVSVRTFLGENGDDEYESRE